MKQLLFLTGLGWLLWGTPAFGQAGTSLGLAYELAQVKTRSEQKLQLALLKDPVDPELISRYMAVKAAFDPILVQLMADLRVRNRLGCYRDLDKLVKDNQNLGTLPNTGAGAVQRYATAFREGYQTFTALDTYVAKTGRDALVEPADIISGATLLFDIFKDIRDARIKKVENIVALLESLRLSPVAGIDKKDGAVPAGKIQAKK